MDFISQLNVEVDQLVHAMSPDKSPEALAEAESIKAKLSDLATQSNSLPLSGRSRVIAEIIDSAEAISVKKITGIAASHFEHVYQHTHELLLREILEKPELADHFIESKGSEELLRKAVAVTDQTSLIHNDMPLHLNLAIHPSPIIRALAPICYSHGADINATSSKKGCTALHAAVMRHDANLVGVLLANNIDTQAKSLLSPPLAFQLALEKGSASVCLKFLQYQVPCSPEEKLSAFLLLFSSRTWTDDDLPLMESLKDQLLNDHLDSPAYQGLLTTALNYYVYTPPSQEASAITLFYDALLVELLEKQCVFSQDQHGALNSLLANVHARQFKGKHATALVQCLINSKTIFELSPPPFGKSILIEILEDESAPKTVKDAILAKTSPEALQAYQDLRAKMDKMFMFTDWDDSAPHSFRDLIDAIDLETLTKTLESLKYPIIDELKANNNNISSTLKSLENIRIATEKLANSPDSPSYGNELAGWERDAVAYLLAENSHFEALVRSFDAEYEKNYRNKIQFHFLLEKAAVPDPGPTFYHGLAHRFTSAAFYTMLKSYLDSSDFANLADEFAQDRVQQIREEVRAATVLSALHKELSPREYAKQSQKNLSELELGKSTLIPFCSLGHAVLFRASQDSPNTFSLTLYNTGRGLVNNHPQWESTNKYQTHLTVSGIPKSALLDTDRLFDYFSEQEKSDELGATYDFLDALVQCGGTREAPSIREDDYEQKQASGTCAASCFFAYFRHQLVSRHGTESQGLALYKKIKAGALLPWGEGNLSDVDKTIHRCSLPKLTKLKADLELAKASNSKEDSARIAKALKNTLEAMGSQDLTKALNNIEKLPSHNRYLLLRSASKLLAERWMLSPATESPKEGNSELGYAIALWKVRQQAVRHIHQDLKALLDARDYSNFAYTCFGLISSTVHSAIGVEEATLHLNPDKAPEDQKDAVAAGLKAFLIVTRNRGTKEHFERVTNAYTQTDPGPLTRQIIEEVRENRDGASAPVLD